MHRNRKDNKHYQRFTIEIFRNSADNAVSCYNKNRDKTKKMSARVDFCLRLFRFFSAKFIKGNAENFRKADKVFRIRVAFSALPFCNSLARTIKKLRELFLGNSLSLSQIRNFFSKGHKKSAPFPYFQFTVFHEFLQATKAATFGCIGYFIENAHNKVLNIYILIY